MAGTFAYTLEPWNWNPPAGGLSGYHSPPAGAVAVLDLRPLPEQAKLSQSLGYGFFARPEPAVIPGGAILLGSGDCRTIQPTTAQRGNIKTALGLTSNPSGTFLADVLADVLGNLADPTGASMAKPLMPQADGVEVIQLGGHSPVWSRAYVPGEVLAANPSGKANRQRDVYRANMQIAFDAGGPVLLAKALGAVLLQHGYSRAELAAGAPNKQGEWRRMLPPGLSSQVGPGFRPTLPGTSRTETWPTNSAITSGQVFTWTVPRGDFLVVGGRLRANSNFAHSVGLCASAVSSTNHFTQLLFYVIGQPQIFGPATRLSADGGDYYSSSYNTSAGANRLYKSVTGTLTVLSTAAYTFGANDVFKCKANGSTITGIVTGESDLTATDTAITGSLKGGVWIYDDTNAHSLNEFGTWVLDDELPSAPVAEFTGTPLTGTAPLSVAFTDASTNTPTSWLWEKSSDGGSNWSNFASGPTTQNPTESLAAGTWSIRLTASNAGGSNTKTRTDYVVVSAASGHTRRMMMGMG